MTLLYNFFHQLRADFFLPPTKRPTTLQLIVGAVMSLCITLLIVTLSKNVPYYDQWYFIPLLDSLVVA